MLVAFDLAGLIDSNVVTLNATPSIASQQVRLALGRISMDRLPCAALFAGNY